MHGPGGVGRPILSQSEDQSRPHPVLTFVHPMSVQVRGLGPDTAGSAHRSDPQIATRTRKRVSGQVTDYPKNWIKLFGCVSRGRDRRPHHLDPRQKTPRTPFPGIDIGCHPGLRAPRSPGFLQPVCPTPGQGPSTRGPPAPVISFTPLALYRSASPRTGRYPLSVRGRAHGACGPPSWPGGEAGRRAGRDGNPCRPAATDRDGLAPMHLRQPLGSSLRVQG